MVLPCMLSAVAYWPHVVVDELVINGGDLDPQLADIACQLRYGQVAAMCDHLSVR